MEPEGRHLAVLLWLMGSFFLGNTPQNAKIRSVVNSPPSTPPLGLSGMAFVTGPNRSGRTDCMKDIMTNLSEAPGAGMRPAVGVIVVEEGAFGTGPAQIAARLAAEYPHAVAVNRLAMPCVCCPELIALPDAIYSMCSGTRIDRLLVKVPAIAALRLMAEVDRAFIVPRRLIVCLDKSWSKARNSGQMPPFLGTLLSLADEIKECPDIPHSEDAPTLIL